MKTLLFILTTLLYVSLQAQTASLTVKVSGFEGEGSAYIQVYREGQKFDVDSRECIRKKVVIKKGTAGNKSTASATFNKLPAGAYAVMVFHDENGNGKMDSYWFGMPREGVGTSNNHRGMAAFPKSRFELRGDQLVEIGMVYL